MASSARVHHPHETKGSETRAPPKGIPIEKLGWTREMALEARRRLASFLEDWEDPSMNVYDEDP